MERPVLSVLIATLLLASAQAATTADPRGDVAARAFGEPVQQAAVDLVEVRGDLVDHVLALEIEVAGRLPIEGEPEPDRRFSYLFIVGRGEEGTLFQESDLTALCFFHQGQVDLRCEVTDGDGTLRRSGATDRNVSLHVQVPWDGPLRVGAFAHESLPNGTDRDIVAQDFTDNAVPYQPAPDDPPPGGAGGPGGPAPWWRTPWVLLVLLAGVAAALLWRRTRG